ncbi:MAG: hypothetical protein ABIQ56_00035 [Chitinophagaceae bacterium]
MSEDLKDILSNSNKDIDNQKLMDYISGKLSKEDGHDIEKEMVDSEFMSDAVEGLEHFQSKKDLNHLVEQLNRDLHKNLDKKKLRKEKRKLKDQPWLLFAIILLLVVIVISFIAIKKYIDTGNDSTPGIEKSQ